MPSRCESTRTRTSRRIARVIEAERARASVDSADEEVQEMWVQYRRRSAEHSGLVSDAEISLAEESRVPERSAFNPNNPFDVRGYEGELVSKDVSITRHGRTRRYL